MILKLKQTEKFFCHEFVTTIGVEAEGGVKFNPKRPIVSLHNFNWINLKKQPFSPLIHLLSLTNTERVAHLWLCRKWGYEGWIGFSNEICSLEKFTFLFFSFWRLFWIHEISRRWNTEGQKKKKRSSLTLSFVWLEVTVFQHLGLGVAQTGANEDTERSQLWSRWSGGSAVNGSTRPVADMRGRRTCCVGLKSGGNTVTQWANKYSSGCFPVRGRGLKQKPKQRCALRLKHQ